MPKIIKDEFSSLDNRWKRYRKRHPEKVKEAKRNWNLHHQKELRVIANRVRIKAREEVLLLLGNKCCQCGESDRRCLQIDHVHGGGNKEHRKYGGWLFSKIRNEIKAGSKEYQLLCANCNWRKRHTNEK